MLSDLQDDEGVRAGELELLHHSFELNRIFLIEHCKRVVRRNGATRGDEGTARQYNQLPSHGVSPLLIAPTARTTHQQRRPYQWNANVVVGAGKKHRPLRMRCPPMAPLLPPIVTNGDTGISRFQAAGGRTSQDRPASYYIRSSMHSKGRAVNWASFTPTPMRKKSTPRPSGNRICAANHEFYAFFIMQKYYGLEG